MIKAYKLKDGTIIPVTWNSTIRSGKLEYWNPVGGGYKKTKVFESVEIDIPEMDAALPWLQIVKINLEYGESVAKVYAENKVAGIVCLPYLRAYTALYQKASEFIDQMDGKQTFFTGEEFFEKFAVFDYFLAMGGVYTLDITKVDDILDKIDEDYDAEKCTYQGKNVSMQEYLEIKYGKLASEAVSAMI